MPQSSQKDKKTNIITKFSISEAQLNMLMELDIMKCSLQMDFPPLVVKNTLKRRLETVGLPYLYLETCIEHLIDTSNSMFKKETLENIIRD